jgi:hypothetical protein
MRRIVRSRTSVVKEVSANPQTRAFAELLIDCEEDRTLRAVLVGMLPELQQCRPDPHCLQVGGLASISCEK